MLSFEELRSLFQDARSLPKLPTAALEILDILQNEHASGQEIERIILRDPALTTGLLRVANSAMYGGLGNVSTVQSAVLRLGIGSVRSLALSMAVTSVTKSASGNFNAEAFARHGVFVGFLTRFLFARRKVVEVFGTGWTGDEMFAAGIMHDLPIGLLSKVSAETFNVLLEHAKDNCLSFREAFGAHYELSLGELGAESAKAWNLPGVFVDTLTFVESPLEHPTEAIALACLNLANDIANRSNWAFENWEVAMSQESLFAAQVGLGPDELGAGVEAVDRHANAFLGTAKAA